MKELLNQGFNKPRKGVDAGDHPPITPMKAATEAELGHDGWRLYDYITRHFIATVSVRLSIVNHSYGKWLSEIICHGFQTLDNRDWRFT